MGKVVKMPAASRPEQIASLMPKSRNGRRASAPVRKSRHGPGRRGRFLRLVPAKWLSCQVPSFIMALPSGSGIGPSCLLTARDVPPRRELRPCAYAATPVRRGDSGGTRCRSRHCRLPGIPRRPDVTPSLKSNAQTAGLNTTLGYVIPLTSVTQYTRSRSRPPGRPATTRTPVVRRCCRLMRRASGAPNST